MIAPPLAGLLVADFSRVLAGPFASMTLADLGATVVKVERPGLGDDTRSWGPPWTGMGESAYFESLNRSKLGIALNLDDPHDRRMARRLVTRADVVIENFLTGTMERFGLGFDDVRTSNPTVVYCSITGFGSGAGATTPGYDFIVQAVGGLMSITGEPSGDPTRVGVAVVDVLAAKDAITGILAALRVRDRDGIGQRVEINLLSSLLGSLVNQTGGFLATGVAPGRLGNAHPSVAPYQTLKCRNGLLAVACGNDRQFARLASTIGRPDLATDPRFAQNSGRVVNRPSLVEVLEAHLATEDAEAWEARLLAVGVPVGRVGDIASAVERAEQLGLAPTTEVGEGHPRQITHPVRYSSLQPVPCTAPPRVGQHNDVLRAWLSGDSADVRSLAELRETPHA
jgi:crotonobetainyl-CoA:carnitine CoA-transferase CaiB-like acyl-CoA transferase